MIHMTETNLLSKVTDASFVEHNFPQHSIATTLTHLTHWIRPACSENYTMLILLGENCIVLTHWTKPPRADSPDSLDETCLF